MSRKTLITDLLFGVQFVCTLIFGGSQFWRMLSTTQGVSISWFATWEAFLLLNLVLAIRAHQNQASRVTWQTIASYATWMAMVTLDLGVMLWKQSGTWGALDSATALAAAAGVAATLLVANYKELPITDPMIKGYFAVFFKAVPQLALAVNMVSVGSNGLAVAALITGHVTILTRVGQLWFSIREAGWDRNRIGSAISEVANEASWVVVTIAWLLT